MAFELRRRFEGKAVLVTAVEAVAKEAFVLLEEGAHFNGEDVLVDGGMQA